jgi:hypothetical protein
MSEQQLREAFELMKQGEKNQAMMLVRGILRQDRENVDAWWLMANLLEDEDKILKCLNQILELNPNHQGARKKLTTLRPDLAQSLAPADDPAKKKKDDIYWDKLNSPPPKQKSGSSLTMGILGLLGMRFAFRIVLLVIFLGIGAVAAIFNSVNTQLTLPDDNGNTPQIVVKEFMVALWLEDVDTLYRLSCPEYYGEVDSIVESLWGGDYSAWTVDSSQTEFDLYYYSGNQAYVTIKGHMSMSDGIDTYSIDWDADAQQDGYDFYGEHVYRSNGIWQVCISRYVPNLNEDA